jgi:hypothetical protein
MPGDTRRNHRKRVLGGFCVRHCSWPGLGFLNHDRLSLAAVIESH